VKKFLRSSVCLFH